MSDVKKDTITRFYYTVRLPIIVIFALLLTALVLRFTNNAQVSLTPTLTAGCKPA